MEPISLILLIAVFGLAEILPVDAQGHALLAAQWFGLHAGILAFFVHVGVALALAAYLWRDMAQIGNGLWKLKRQRVEPGLILLGRALVAALPLGVVGGAHLPMPFSPTPVMAGIITICAAIIMAAVDQMSLTVKRIEHLGAFEIFALGLLQLLALVPGVGRLAMIVTLCRAFGLERQECFRFAWLVIFLELLAMAGGETVALVRDRATLDITSLEIIGLAFAATLIVAPLALALLKRAGLLPFALYRLLVGVALLTAK